MTQKSSKTLVRKSSMTMEKAQASSIRQHMCSCSDFLTKLRLCMLLTASILGRMQVLIRNANRCLATGI